MNILLLTKSKKYTCEILKYLITNHHVVGVVCKNYGVIQGTRLEKICKENNIQIIDNSEMYKLLEKKEMPQVDLAISNTYGRLIKSQLLEWVNGNCINFHGAILPKYKGLYTYNHGLLQGEKEWGVTAHYVNEKFDEGNIIAIKKFPICPDAISVKELEDLTQKAAYELTLELLGKWVEEGPLPAVPQDGTGKYYSQEDFERAKEVFVDDSAEDVRRKIHAFWCPPYEGAYIKIGGEHFQLMPEEMKSDK